MIRHATKLFAALLLTTGFCSCSSQATPPAEDVGFGESLEDLAPFDAEKFAAGLLGDPVQTAVEN